MPYKYLANSICFGDNSWKKLIKSIVILVLLSKNLRFWLKQTNVQKKLINKIIISLVIEQLKLLA